MNSYLYLGEYEKFLQSLPANDSAYILFYRGLAEYYLNHRDRRPGTLIALSKGTFFASRQCRKGTQLLDQA